MMEYGLKLEWTLIFFALCFDVICRSWGWVPKFQNLHLQGPGKLRNIMMGGPGQMGGPSNIMGGPAPPNETML